MNKIKSLVGVFAFALLVLALPAVASAQWRNDDDRYGNNRNGQYDNRYLKSTVQRLKDNAKNFDRNLERSLDRRNNRGYNNNRQVLDISDDFRKITDDFEDKFGNGRNLRNSESMARQMLQVAQSLERELSNSRVDYNMSNDWNYIRQDLQQIANAYGLRYNGRGGIGNGSWRDRFPIRLPF